MRVDASVAWRALGEPPWTPPRIPTAPLPAACDVAVVGAGVTGLSCALALADRGLRVVVLDRHMGHGAASRSGGIIVGDTLIGPAPGFDGCERDLRAWIDTHHVACDLTWRGCWEMDRDAALPPTPVDWHDAGAIRVSKTVDGGTLDPSRLLEALARHAAARGAVLVDDAGVTDYAGDGDGVRLSGTRLTLRARRVLCAIDATGRPASADAWPARQLTIALETAPLSDAIAERIGWRERLPFYTNDLPLLWGRGLATGGMIVGRELIPMPVDASLPGPSVEEAEDHAALSARITAAGVALTARVRALHPALTTIEIAKVWAGPIARDVSGVPSIEPDVGVPNVWWAGGYGGHGLAQAFRLGTRAATIVGAGLSPRGE